MHFWTLSLDQWPKERRHFTSPKDFKVSVMCTLEEWKWCWDVDVVLPCDKTHHYVLHVLSASFHPTPVKHKEESWRICLLSGNEGLGKLELSRTIHFKISYTIAAVKCIVFLWKFQGWVGLGNKQVATKKISSEWNSCFMVIVLDGLSFCLPKWVFWRNRNYWKCSFSTKTIKKIKLESRITMLG